MSHAARAHGCLHQALVQGLACVGHKMDSSEWPHMVGYTRQLCRASGRAAKRGRG